MVENLKTTRYNDGTAIPLVTDSAAWGNLSTPGCCWYNNDSVSFGATYGALYNWYTVNTDKLAPSGWHVANDSEWTILTTYFGGIGVAGRKLKETGTSHWASPNTGVTNESEFTALPGGWRDTNGTFYEIGSSGYWWSGYRKYTNSGTVIQLWYRSMVYNYPFVFRNGYSAQAGYSVRCVRDN
jgi:uncharacterized protein (TIGR02145 family)